MNMSGDKDAYILGDLRRHPLRGDPLNADLLKHSGQGNPWLGRVLIAPPFEAHVSLDFTGPPGSVLGVYYSLIFQLNKWEYKFQKADEWIEVSPAHAQFYQLTQKQKEDLEGRIKQGLVSVSQSIADMELLMHDQRRYREFLGYLGFKDKDGNVDVQNQGKTDEHSLKAVFIDQVDAHTGEGISMRSIVSRWPTLITDFIAMEDNDTDISKVADKLKVSKAEAVVLVTKNKLYQEWKRLFGPEIRNRYERIEQLLQARQESVDQYREWLKPYIARHKLLKEGLSSSGNRAFKTTSPFEAGGVATSSSQIQLYVWKDFLVPEIFKGGSETTAKMNDSGSLRPDDNWTRKNLIFSKRYGLINKYPWITKKWVDDMAKQIKNEKLLTPHKVYYSFFVITLDRNTIRMPNGEEFDDGVFDVNMIVMSQNAVFTKILELKAQQTDMEHYIDKLLGIHKPFSGAKAEEEKESKISNILDKISLPFSFVKRGPYERDFNDRVTKIYAARCAQERYAPIVKFLKQRMGVI